MRKGISPYEERTHLANVQNLLNLRSRLGVLRLIKDRMQEIVEGQLEDENALLDHKEAAELLKTHLERFAEMYSDSLEYIEENLESAEIELEKAKRRARK